MLAARRMWILYENQWYGGSFAVLPIFEAVEQVLEVAPVGEEGVAEHEGDFIAVQFGGHRAWEAWGIREKSGAFHGTILFKGGVVGLPEGGWTL